MSVPPGSAAILGGSFNPVHNGHVYLATELQKAFGFEPLWVVPSRTPPHKEAFTVGGNDRLAMVRLAFENIPQVRISDFELKSAKTSYSIDTIEHVLSHDKPDGKLYFILGEDAFSILPSWHRAAEVLSLCSFLVVTRQGQPAETFDAVMKELKSRNLLAPNQSIEKIRLKPPRVSSTEVREKLSRNESIRGLVPSAVAKYLETNGLYGSS